MPARSILIMALGALVAVGIAYSLLSRAPETAPKTQVMIAGADIPAGAFVRSDYHLALADWPEANITPSMLTSANSKLADYEGAVARRAIKRGEPISDGSLVKSTEGGFMSAVLDPGKRAVSVAVDATSGNAGFIFPGDHVDLILTHQMRGAAGRDVERASETFIEDVRVLAVDQMLDNPENSPVLAKTVTLEVSPKQAEEINVAKDLGKISLSLRSLATKQPEEAPAAPEPTTFDDVLMNMAPEPIEPQNVTRDTDVSKVITTTEGNRVRILRGGVPAEDIEFNTHGVSSGSGQELR